MTTTGERLGLQSESARKAMINSQLRTSGINEQWVLAAMASVPREDFVPEAMRSAAYIDRAIPLEDGTWLASPLTHGKMLAEAAPTFDDKTLLVGNDDGYLAALLRPLVAALDAIDPADAIEKRGKGSYSLLVIDGAIEHLPSALASQVAEGGRVVAGLVERGVTRLAAGCKTGAEISLLPLAELGIPVLPQFAAPKSWSF